MAINKGAILRMDLPDGEYRYFRIIGYNILSFHHEVEFLDTHECYNMSWEDINRCVQVGD
jgi:hypothetical protein